MFCFAESKDFSFSLSSSLFFSRISKFPNVSSIFSLRLLFILISSLYTLLFTYFFSSNYYKGFKIRGYGALTNSMVSIFFEFNSFSEF
jgi:hypothetical protein